MRVSKYEWGILLDLDQTLVLTAAIEPLRRRGHWPDVYRSFDKTSVPPGTRQFIAYASRIGKVAVVTTAPRTYAQRLLAFHRLEVPVAIAYHDVTRIKPDPQPILKAAEKLKIPASRCIHIGDSTDDIAGAHAAGAVPVLLCWTGLAPSQRAVALARAVCRNWSDVIEFIRTLVQDPETGT